MIHSFSLTKRHFILALCILIYMLFSLYQLFSSAQVDRIEDIACVPLTSVFDEMIEYPLIMDHMSESCTLVEISVDTRHREGNVYKCAEQARSWDCILGDPRIDENDNWIPDTQELMDEITILVQAIINGIARDPDTQIIPDEWEDPNDQGNLDDIIDTLEDYIEKKEEKESDKWDNNDLLGDKDKDAIQEILKKLKEKEEEEKRRREDILNNLFDEKKDLEEREKEEREKEETEFDTQSVEEEKDTVMDEIYEDPRIKDRIVDGTIYLYSDEPEVLEKALESLKEEYDTTIENTLELFPETKLTPDIVVDFNIDELSYLDVLDFLNEQEEFLEFDSATATETILEMSPKIKFGTDPETVNIDTANQMLDFLTNKDVFDETSTYEEIADYLEQQIQISEEIPEILLNDFSAFLESTEDIPPSLMEEVAVFLQEQWLDVENMTKEEIIEYLTELIALKQWGWWSRNFVDSLRLYGNSRLDTSAPFQEISPVSDNTVVMPSMEERIERATGNLKVKKQEHLEVIGFEKIEKCVERWLPVKVAIVDNGFDLVHEDLENEIVEMYDIADHDEDAQVPVYIKAWNHGTKEAGLVGATANDVWVQWVAPSSELIVIKSTKDTENGRDITHGIEAVAKAYDMWAEIINLSRWWFGNVPMLERITKKIANKWATIVAAAWNYNKEEEFYPAAYDWVIGVAAIGLDGSRASFSNYGDRVDISAPGEQIMTTDLNNTYNAFNGTSEAAPIVAGTIATAHSIWLSRLDVRKYVSDSAEQGMWLGSLDLDFFCDPEVVPEEFQKSRNALERTTDYISDATSDFVDSLSTRTTTFETESFMWKLATSVLGGKKNEIKDGWVISTQVEIQSWKIVLIILLLIWSIIMGMRYAYHRMPNTKNIV